MIVQFNRRDRFEMPFSAQSNLESAFGPVSCGIVCLCDFYNFTYNLNSKHDNTLRAYLHLYKESKYNISMAQMNSQTGISTSSKNVKDQLIKLMPSYESNYVEVHLVHILVCRTDRRTKLIKIEYLFVCSKILRIYQSALKRIQQIKRRKNLRDNGIIPGIVVGTASVRPEACSRNSHLQFVNSSRTVVHFLRAGCRADHADSIIGRGHRSRGRRCCLFAVVLQHLTDFGPYGILLELQLVLHDQV